MNALTLSKKVQLRARDGGRCWLCQRPINFKAEPNSDLAPSFEHLVPQSREGPDCLENLVLCHPPCNKKLANLSLAEKIRMRDDYLRQHWLKQLRRKIVPMFADHPVDAVASSTSTKRVSPSQR